MIEQCLLTAADQLMEGGRHPRHLMRLYHIMQRHKVPIPLDMLTGLMAAGYTVAWNPSTINPE